MITLLLIALFIVLTLAITYHFIKEQYKNDIVGTIIVIMIISIILTGFIFLGA